MTATLSPSATEFYDWNGYRCAYECWEPAADWPSNRPALLLVHPIGVGLSRRFWDRFRGAWQRRAWDEANLPLPVYNPDLLGCGESAMPRYALRPDDWAEQLSHFLKTVVRRPAIVVAQGALLPVAVDLAERARADGALELAGLVFSGPPAWATMTRVAPAWQQRLTWNLLESPLGSAFFRYARRRQFLASFSDRQLFARTEDIDETWLSMLATGAADPASRHAVFAFLSRFWQTGYGEAIARLEPPTLVLFGDAASSISRSGKGESSAERARIYADRIPNGRSRQIPGRNVLPYESTEAFAEAVLDFVRERI